MDDFAIRVQNVSKNFHYTSGRAGTIKSLLTSTFKNSEVAKKDVQHALTDVSFDIKKGEFFGIVGRNGSGKSTLLKMIAGIYQPNSGKIHVSGKLVPFIELGVGFNPELTGRENVYLNGALLGFSRKEIEAQYDEIVEFAELGKFMDQQLKNYSSGMQVRLAFSMAVRAKADVLLIDEVLAVGDADFQRKCFDYFKQLKHDEKTVIFVSHDMEAVRQYCDRAVLIESSKLILSGSPEKVAIAYTRLFNSDTKQDATVKNNGKRMGDRKVYYDTVSITVNEKTIDIKQTITAEQPVSNYVLGLRIKTSAGQQVAGTNTTIMRSKTKSLDKGDSSTITWSFPNVFSDGSYNIDVVITHEDGVTVHDFWEDAQPFTVRRDRQVAYAIDLDFDISQK
ncbi:MAG: ABC transporter ATP-binding protein [Candidatus Saccharibacteria bacterium]|nr:ABC transporter ATP-binding protein [Candidatus Saccharibacteria bacterium]